MTDVIFDSKSYPQHKASSNLYVGGEVTSYNCYNVSKDYNKDNNEEDLAPQSKIKFYLHYLRCVFQLLPSSCTDARSS